MWYLRLKHWQVFCILFPTFIMQNFTWGQNTALIQMTGYLIYFVCPLAMGTALHAIAGKKFDLNHNFFLINALISLTVMVVTGFFGGFHVTGLAAIPLFYFFYAALYCYTYPAKALKAIESGKDVSLGDYIGDFFSYYFSRLAFGLFSRG
jgi:hypothetical protein